MILPLEDLSNPPPPGTEDLHIPQTQLTETSWQISLLKEISEGLFMDF